VFFKSQGKKKGMVVDREKLFRFDNRGEAGESARPNRGKV